MLAAAVFLAGELFMPGIAERRLRGDLRERGSVERVEVRAFPALKLLFGRADRVEVEMGEARAGEGEVADELVRTRGTDVLDARARVLRIGPLRLRDARLTKDGDRLHGGAALAEADLAAALPARIGLRPVESGDGHLVLEATAPVFGQELSIRARLSAREGALVIAPEGLLGGLATLTVFSDERVAVRAVGAEPTAGGFLVSSEARLTSGA